MQITERIDTALDGGVLDILGGTFRNVWYWPAVIYFGLTGGLIAANFNPIIAILTATGPLAPAWFFVKNTAHVIPAAFLAQNAFEKRLPTKEGISLKYFLLNMVIPAHFLLAIAADTSLAIRVQVAFPFLCWSILPRLVYFHPRRIYWIPSHPQHWSLRLSIDFLHTRKEKSTMSMKAIIIAIVVALIGGTYEVLADVGPLKGMNFGLGLTSGPTLSKTIGIPGGYNVADIVMVVVFLVVIAIAFIVLNNMKNKENK